MTIEYSLTTQPGGVDRKQWRFVSIPSNGIYEWDEQVVGEQKSYCDSILGAMRSHVGQVPVVPASLPSNSKDPYAGSSNADVAGWAIAEAKTVEDKANQCIDDLEALSEHRPTSSVEKSTPEAVGFFFSTYIQGCCIADIHKLHDSMLLRLPTLRDPDMEPMYEDQIQNRDGCWTTMGPSIPQYLREMANGLLAYKAAK